ncbi:MAG TPA: hypothetical protein VFY45_10175 [Baekduia sp.]|nr:hypothetical protein [Baekduia sp.]
MNNDITQWDGIALPYLMKHGASSAEQIMHSTEIDQFDQQTVPAWIESALSRGLIEVTGGSGASTRFNITDQGRGFGR